MNRASNQSNQSLARLQEAADSRAQPAYVRVADVVGPVMSRQRFLALVELEPKLAPIPVTFEDGRRVPVVEAREVLRRMSQIGTA